MLVDLALGRAGRRPGRPRCLPSRCPARMRSRSALALARAPWRRGRRSGPCRSRWRRSSARWKSRSVRAIAASASFIRASASSTAASGGRDVLGPGRRLELVELRLGRRPARPRAPRAAPCTSRSSIRKSGSPALTFSPFLTKTSVTTPGTLTPIGMFSRRASTSPAPAIILIAVGPGRRLDDRLRAGGGTAAPGPPCRPRTPRPATASIGNTYFVNMDRIVLRERRRRDRRPTCRRLASGRRRPGPLLDLGRSGRRPCGRSGRRSGRRGCRGSRRRRPGRAGRPPRGAVP